MPKGAGKTSRRQGRSGCDGSASQGIRSALKSERSDGGNEYRAAYPTHGNCHSDVILVPSYLAGIVFARWGMLDILCPAKVAHTIA